MNQLNIESQSAPAEPAPGEAIAPASAANGLMQQALRGAELAATGVALVAFSPVILSMHASQILHKRFFDNGDTAA
jgi:hypothetical protein